jgi:hypothetical protein
MSVRLPINYSVSRRKMGHTTALSQSQIKGSAENRACGVTEWGGAEGPPANRQTHWRKRE